VAPRLWVGSKPPVDRDMAQIDLLVLCAEEFQPASLAFHGRLIHCPLPDAALSSSEVNMAIVAGVTVAQALANGRRVLVTCALGLNRSALVAGIALSQLTTMSAGQIVELIRERRGREALSNMDFVYLLNRLVGDGRDKKKAPRRRRTDD
jgi:protein-tyrosine phosphatase